MENKDWYELQELADEFSIPIARIRNVVSVLESADPSFQIRDKPGDKRYKQVGKDSVAKVRNGLGFK